MHIVKISKDGWLIGPNKSSSVDDIEIEVSDETYSKISFIPFTKNWRYVDGDFVLEDLFDNDFLKLRRQKECFNIIDNRSQMWYNHLTQEQKNELDIWYQAWLDVTETHIIPVKPEWLE